MTTQGFTVSHLRDAAFDRGLRSYFEYRDLGIAQATEGRVVAHVIRPAAGTACSGQSHLHRTTFQMVYVLKGWATFEYAGQGERTIRQGDCINQVPGIPHREIACSDDFEVLEIVAPADFKTRVVDAP